MSVSSSSSSPQLGLHVTSDCPWQLGCSSRPEVHTGKPLNTGNVALVAFVRRLCGTKNSWRSAATFVVPGADSGRNRGIRIQGNACRHLRLPDALSAATHRAPRPSPPTRRPVCSRALWAGHAMRGKPITRHVSNIRRSHPVRLSTAGGSSFIRTGAT